MSWETWEEVVVWEWCPSCMISWRPGDKPTCTCELMEASQ